MNVAPLAVACWPHCVVGGTAATPASGLRAWTRGGQDRSLGDVGGGGETTSCRAAHTRVVLPCR